MFGFLRKARASTLRASTSDDAAENIPVSLEGRLCHCTATGDKLLGEATLRGGRLMHRSDKGDSTIRVSELTLVEITSPLDFSFCVATSAAFVMEYSANSADSLVYWVEGLRDFIGQERRRSVGDDVNMPSAADADAYAPEYVPPSTPDFYGPASTEEASSIVESAIPLSGPLWMLKDNGECPKQFS